MKKLIIWGSGGHSKIAKDMAEACGYNVAGFIADDDMREHLGCKVYHNVDEIKNQNKYCYFIARGDNSFRKIINEKYNKLEFINIIHPTSIISKYAKFGYGNLFMPYTVINAFAEIGNQNIINTSAIIEHDCKVGDYCHISVKSAITGTVTVGNGVFLGAGATVKNNVSIGEWSTIGVGASVTNNLDSYGVYVGCPAKLLYTKEKI